MRSIWGDVVRHSSMPIQNTGDLEIRMLDHVEGLESRVQSLTERILADYENGRVIDRLEMFTQPDRQVIHELIGKLLRLVFPGYYRDYSYRIYNPKNSLSALIEDVAFLLNRQIAIALRGNGRCPDEHINHTPGSARPAPCAGSASRRGARSCRAPSRAARRASSAATRGTAGSRTSGHAADPR